MNSQVLGFSHSKALNVTRPPLEGRRININKTINNLLLTMKESRFVGCTLKELKKL